MDKKQVVVVGGGTGTHTVLRGLREYADIIDIKAIVSMADSGGSTGRLRDEFGYLPIGDVRNALAALANTDHVLLRELFLYRFNKGEGLSGHNFGNLFITALTDILGSEVEAIKAAASILNVVGEVIPVTTTNTKLVATYDDGSVLIGEHEIDEALSAKPNSRIVELSLSPRAEMLDDAYRAIVEADMVVLGPGDLYTSILANCVVDGFAEALSESRAKVVYVCNLMSKRGQTMGMHAAEHIMEIARHIGRVPDVALVNSELLNEDLVQKYEAEGDHPILNNCDSNGVCTIEAVPLISGDETVPTKGDVLKRSLIRHDSHALAKNLMGLL
jgi:uncharacterized cofD-like protein